MGIQFFSKVFRPYNTIKLKELSGRTIAIDAMTEIYRAVLGSKSVGMLTDKNGNNTMHINVIMANIIEMQKLGIKTIWVFDHVNSTEEKQHHNPDKANELLKRRQRKDDAKEQLKELQLKDQLNKNTKDKVSIHILRV
jgi:5'-3' exonuclease